MVWFLKTSPVRWFLRNTITIAKKSMLSIGQRIRMNPLEYVYSFFFKMTLWAFMRSRGITWAQVKEAVSDPGIARCFMLVTESLAEHGLTVPMVLSAPFSVVFNLTNRCNLKCKHCFQRAHVNEKDHMTLEQKLNIIDQKNAFVTGNIPI